jgi:type IV pilus assembly protein PilB
VSPQKKSLGERLVASGIITQDQLKRAQDEESRSAERLRNVLVRLGFIAEEDLVSFISQELGLPRVELTNYIIDPKIIELVPEELARKYGLVPMLKIGDRITCAMTDPWNVFAMDEVRMKTGFIVEPAVATVAEIKKAIDQFYGAKGTMDDLVKSIASGKLGLEPGKEIDAKKLEGLVEEPIVIRLVNLIIMTAVKEGASDIHIEPEEDTLKTRLRRDGMMHEITSPPKHLQSAIISRIKIMANLDIAERRIPQDGRFTVKVEGRQIDVRVSCIPTIYGENVVMRLLDSSGAMVGLEGLGFPKDMLERYSKLILRPHGIILVTGPTGSGKTTTLYSSLVKINTVEKNIITIEDPVEYKLAGIRQTQVDVKVDLTFANGLRSILRQDPDIIMVGEIRDFETAEIAIQAALTGHLVLSTLHTNDAPSAITRLVDMGVEPFLASSSVIAILAQRLVRKICPDCKEKYVPSEEELGEVRIESTEDRGQSTEKRGQRTEIVFYKGKGCPKCMNTGYKGRVGIYELLVPDEKMHNAIIAKAPADEIRKLARAAGMKTMMEDGIDKIREGVGTSNAITKQWLIWKKSPITKIQ